MNICIVAGARPNFIKVAPLIRAINKAGQSGQDTHFSLVYTGRDDDPTLESRLYGDLSIDGPDAFLGADSDNLNELTGQVMSKFERYLVRRPADVVVVVDDLASTMAVSIVAKKQGSTLAHIAAGTRSFDITIPKEINRLVIDGLSDLLFTAGISNNSIANREGAPLSRVYMVGNILMDNLRYLRGRLRQPSLMRQADLHEGGYIVFTLNRKALLARPDRLAKTIGAINRGTAGIPVVAPLRPQSASVISPILQAQDVSPARFRVVDPMDYLDFTYLTTHAHAIITDSGNVAEEATFNGVPCMTLNNYTEHIETVKVGTNVLVGDDTERLSQALDTLAAGKWKQGALPDRWDGRTAERILQILVNERFKP